MTDRDAPPEWGFGYRQGDPYEDDGWFGREEAAEPPFADDVQDTPPAVDRPPAPPSHRPATPTINTWTVNGQLRASDPTALRFQTAPTPWYRTKQARIALIAVAAAAVVVPIVLLLWPDSVSQRPGPSTSVTPAPSTTTPPALSSSPPSVPVNPPPPPPPPEDTGTTPTNDQPYWTRPAPEPTRKPDVGVTRTPVTRAPISVAPQQRQPPAGSANPGDGRKGFRCGGWC